MSDECPYCHGHFTYRKNHGTVVVCRNCGQESAASSAGYGVPEQEYVPSGPSQGQRMHDIMNMRV